MRPSLLHLVSVVLAALVAGCSVPSPYREQGIAGGYSEVQIDRNTFRVTYAGTIVTKQSETDERAILRSAEVALDHGYPYFVTSGIAPTGSAVSLATNVVSVPATTITIFCFAYRPETTAVVYDAASIVSTVGPKYHVF